MGNIRLSHLHVLMNFLLFRDIVQIMSMISHVFLRYFMIKSSHVIIQEVWMVH